MKKLISAVLLLFLPSISFVVNSCSKETAAVSASSDNYTLLFCGFDDASENTDSIVLANYVASENTLNFLQIPRDTYYSEAPYKKINSVFPSKRAAGLERNEAMEALVASITNSIGVSIDAYIGYSMDTFVAFIDTIGGVDLYLPSSFVINSSGGDALLSLSPGMNHINGEQSLLFVRARKGYTGGDLSRVDAQKIFLSAFMNKIKNDLKVIDIIRACIMTSSGWTLDFKFSEILKIIVKNKGRISNITTHYATLPGEAGIASDGYSYYFLSKPSSERLLDEFGFSRSKEFDTGRVFYNALDPTAASIYTTVKDYKIYDDDSLSHIDLSSK